MMTTWEINLKSRKKNEIFVFIFISRTIIGGAKKILPKKDTWPLKYVIIYFYLPKKYRKHKLNFIFFIRKWHHDEKIHEPWNMCMMLSSNPHKNINWSWSMVLRIGKENCNHLRTFFCLCRPLKSHHNDWEHGENYNYART